MKQGYIEWERFHAAIMLVDHSAHYEWSTKYLYVVPEEVTRDRYDGYLSVANGFGMETVDVHPLLRFYLKLPYHVAAQRNRWVFDDVPWPKGWKHHKVRPVLSLRFRLLQAHVANLREFTSPSTSLTRRRILEGDPFCQKWRDL